MPQCKLPNGGVEENERVLLCCPSAGDKLTPLSFSEHTFPVLVQKACANCDYITPNFSSIVFNKTVVKTIHRSVLPTRTDHWSVV